MESRTSMAMKSWEEKPYQDLGAGRKLAHVDAAFHYAGEMEGESTAVWLLSYNPGGAGEGVCLERFEGTLGGRAGTFVFRHVAVFDAKSTRDAWTVIPGSGTGQLEGLAGEASYTMAGHGPYPLRITWSIGGNGSERTPH